MPGLLSPHLHFFSAWASFFSPIHPVQNVSFTERTVTVAISPYIVSKCMDILLNKASAVPDCIIYESKKSIISKSKRYRSRNYIYVHSCLVYYPPIYISLARGRHFFLGFNRYRVYHYRFRMITKQRWKEMEFMTPNAFFKMKVTKKNPSNFFSFFKGKSNFHRREKR